MALPTAPAGVTFSYNGITFPVSIKTNVREKPIESGDGRVVKNSQITISVDGYVSMNEAGNLVPLDVLMRTWRTSLQKNGKTLTYVNKGYGVDLTINAAGGGGTRDVAMGPKAGEFTWEPLGGAPVGCFAAKFHWSVQTVIPECTSARFLPGAGVFTEISYTVAYAQDEAGLTTITTTGLIEIPLSLQLNNTITTNVDQYFAAAIALAPIGFIRKAQRQVSADRRSCTFTLTDTELEVAYPPDVVLIDGEHRVRDMGTSGGFGLGLRWDCSFSGTVRMSPTAARALAWTRFWTIVFDRIQTTRQSTPVRADGSRMATANRVFVTPPILEFAETLFKNQSRFNVRYKILQGVTLQNIFVASGLWNPLAGTDFAVWSGSLSSNAQKTGGIAGASFDPASEVIIDVCSGTAPDGAVSSGRANALAADQDLLNAALEAQLEAEFEPLSLLGDEDLSPASGVFGGGTVISPPDSGGITGTIPSGVIVPEPAGSWSYWTCTVRRLVDHHVIRHKPLSGTVTYSALPFDPMKLAEAEADTSKPGILVASSVADIIQQTSSPSVTLVLQGWAQRIGYRINPPRLVSFGGNVPTLKYEDVAETEESAGGGLIVYHTSWTLTYIVNSIVDTVDLPANPMLGVEGQVG